MPSGEQEGMKAIGRRTEGKERDNSQTLNLGTEIFPERYKNNLLVAPCMAEYVHIWVKSDASR